MMMQFVCTARSADDEDYRPLAETPLTLDFAYDHGVSTLADPAVWQVTLTNNAAAPWRGVVKLELCVAYDAPRFFLPGFLYGRNRGEAPIRVDNRYPRLRAGTPEFPASPWWMVRADRLSHPAAFLLDGGRWYGLSAAPYFVRQNGVLQPWQPGRAGTFAQFAGFTCSLNTGSVGYTLGYGIMGFTGAEVLLAAAFFLVGIAKGSAMNACTILVSDNSADRTRGMNLMHSCYACGALLCPFLIAAAAKVSTSLAVFLLAALGVVLWLVYLKTPMGGKVQSAKAAIDWSFLRSYQFWLLTGLLFCQNAAEQSVVGWMVTYFKDSGIIAGTLAAYTVTVMWGATLIGRLLIAFVFPLKQPRKAMVFMAVFCTAFYFAMMQTHSQLPAILLLFAFAFSMAGMNPTAVASAGKMTTVTSMGIMLPVASSGAILMPWVIGKVAESAGLAVGMATNIVPCVGLIVFAILVSRMREE